ncbi:MAG: L,D-transpeptidase family protein [Gemmatimonadetes bacterium]|nr:L,D-transpeptidase family protein [Gemmatimonadota bacterium]
MLLPLLAALMVTARPDSTRFALALRATVDAPAVSSLRWGTLGDVREGLRGAYDRHGWRPLWSSGGNLTPAAKAVLRELRESRDRGLDPDDYDATWLEAEAGNLGGRSDSLRAVWDLALSAATARYALALDRGRVDPRALHATLLLARDPFDIPGTLVSLAASPNPVPALRALEPPFYHYRRLVSVLQTYRLLAADSSLAALPDIPRGLRPGAAYPGAPKLRRLLTLLGDLTDSSAVNRAVDGDTLYDDALAKAIKHFQRRQGFGPDGIIGDSTRLRLTRTFASQVRQIELTLERWRWLPRVFSAPPIIVNIPGFRLYALRGPTDAESEMLTMDVVVGNAVKHDTPLLAVDLVAVQFQPPWNVPTSIQREEIRPKAIADSGYLAKEQYELLVGGKVVVPTDSLIRKIGYGVAVRQKPGTLNSLGRVKFVMPNSSDIYLHDTPARALFARVRRDFSHGCIRVSLPATLAAFLLRDQPKWPSATVDSAMAGDSTKQVRLTSRIPVVLVYQTVEVRESGEAFFYRDIYGHDRARERALRKGYPYVKEPTGLSLSTAPRIPPSGPPRP